MGRHLRPVAPGVWCVSGGLPLPTMNVYLIEDHGGGVTAFDAGASSMADRIRRVAGKLGGLNRIVLGHGHPDHRGAAPDLDVPVLCHEANRTDAEGDGGRSYRDVGKLGPHGRVGLVPLFELWDGGPVEISDTVAEGDDVSGFEVIDLSGHAPGHIGLLRASDGIALTSDCFYTVDAQTGIRGKPRLPHPALSFDEAAARDAVRKLADLGPRAAWPGHADPVTEDVGATLLRVARQAS